MIEIRKFSKKDTTEVALLMVNVYKEFNREEATKSGWEDYLNTVHPDKVPFEKLYNKLNKAVAFVAIDRGKVIGIVRGTPERINSLFVNGKYQGKGIGKKLVGKFLDAAKKLGVKDVRVRSSVLAVPFYKAMGFKKTTGLRNPHGMKMYNMKRLL
ncbi:GNAT family N-acetyltransferase [Candidatus Gracilibacteria bacterium]|nr:GNAT family N-acetyltransferase [Candidatus Gracilibacteria bacterium]